MTPAPQPSVGRTATVGGGKVDLRDRLLTSVFALDRWLTTKQYRGYDPFDGLTSFLRPLTFQTCLLERILEQLVLRCPWNLRPILGIRPRSDLASAFGLLARGYLRLWLARKDHSCRQKAQQLFQWLVENSCKGYSGYCWGLPFDHSSRAGRVPSGLPYLVETSQIGLAFIDGYRGLDRQEYLDVAVSICRFIINDLPQRKTDLGTCISYHPGRQVWIHNANMLGAAILAATGVLAGRSELVDLARAAIQYSCASQLPDGSWYYGQDSRYHWIDSFHTAYNLEALKCYIDATGHLRYKANLDLGTEFYCRNFFLQDGTPKYYYDRVYPIDIQCAATAIDTLCYLEEGDGSKIQLAAKVADWTIQNMQDPSGYFYYRRLRWKKVKIPTVRWGQAPILNALAHLLLRLHKDPEHGSR